MRRLALASLLLSISCGPHKLEQLYMSLDSDGSRKRETFYTDSQQIWCIAELYDTKPGATVNATIRATQLDGVDGDYTVAVGEAAPQTGKTTQGFQLVIVAPDGTTLTNAPFVPGKYECDVSIDGAPTGSTSFQILMPPCPAYPAVQGTVCGGFYPLGTTCPSTDASRSCVCGANGRWSC